MAVAVAVTILTVKRADAPESNNKSAAPMAAREIIYRPQPWTVY